MSLQLGPIGYTSQARFAPAQGPVGAAKSEDRSVAATASERADRLEFTSTPPDDVRREVEFAYQYAIALARDNRELHFATDDETGKIAVQVRDLDGNVIRTIPNTDLFAVVAGKQAV